MTEMIFERIGVHHDMRRGLRAWPEGPPLDGWIVGGATAEAAMVVLGMPRGAQT